MGVVVLPTSLASLRTSKYLLFSFLLTNENCSRKPMALSCGPCTKARKQCSMEERPEPTRRKRKTTEEPEAGPSKRTKREGGEVESHGLSQVVAVMSDMGETLQAILEELRLARVAMVNGQTMAIAAGERLGRRLTCAVTAITEPSTWQQLPVTLDGEYRSPPTPSVHSEDGRMGTDDEVKTSDLEDGGECVASVPTQRKLRSEVVNPSDQDYVSDEDKADGKEVEGVVAEKDGEVGEEGGEEGGGETNA